MATVATSSVPDSLPVARPTLHWRVLAIGLLFALVHLPLLASHARQLWLRPHYQFFPLLLACSAFLAVIRLREAGPLCPGSRGRYLFFLAASWVVLLLGVLLGSPWLGSVAALGLVAALVYGAGGRALLRRLLPAWGLLWLAIPPPLDLDRSLILSLQGLTTRWSSATLDVLGIFHVREGNVLEVAGK